MVKTYLLLLSTFLLLSTPIATAVAQTGGAYGSAAKAVDVAGTISKVDATSLTIKKTDNSEQTFKVDAATKVTLGGKESTLANLKTGMKVTVQAETDKALSVSATSSPAS